MSDTAHTFPNSIGTAEASARVRVLSPVPSDIDVSQSLAALPIARVAADAGLLEHADLLVDDISRKL